MFSPNKKTILVTGGAGFIGSAVVRYLINESKYTVINLDKLTYSGNLDSLADVFEHPRHIFEKADICNSHEVNRIFHEHQPDAVMHLAAESHVDRSIEGPAEFIQTNILGTYNLLETARNYWSSLGAIAKAQFRFHHISTDEVYGSLGDGGSFNEDSPYRPNSPYSASKAAADHLIRTWYHTYDMPVFISNCSNNYGPYQFPEKLVPHMILNALQGKQLPVYGDGSNIRDWLYVDDHVRALCLILEHGKEGRTYNIGGNCEKSNITVVQAICTILDELLPNSPNRPHASLISFVKDRPGHDKRYSINTSRIQLELGWMPDENFESGLRKTVKWYLKHETWWQRILDGSYRLERIGIVS